MNAVSQNHRRNTVGGYLMQFRFQRGLPQVTLLDNRPIRKEEDALIGETFRQSSISSILSRYATPLRLEYARRGTERSGIHKSVAQKDRCTKGRSRKRSHGFV